MDLRLHGIEASDDERDALDAATGGESAGRRDLLLPALRALQERVGWISPGGLDEICRRLEIPPAEAWGVASFYALLALERDAPVVAHVCDDVVCARRGAEQLCGELTRAFGPEGNAAGRSVGWRRTNCLGQCDRAPAVLVLAAGAPTTELVVAPASSAEVTTAARDRWLAPSSAPVAVGTTLLRRVGVVDPASLDEYLAAGGYAALSRAIEIGPAAVIDAVVRSGLTGRGGAGFPAGRKWEAVAGAPVRPHEIVVNADESEPGTFKDRVLMEGDPFAVVEAATIAGFAVGAERGYVYIRGEYPVAVQRLQTAMDAARERGYLGNDVLGTGRRFDLEIRRGAGAYVCGEETALLNSIEGRRGEPRNRPPFPAEVGLFGRPTLVNNVETLVNVLRVLVEGADVFRATETKLACVSGDVTQPGTHEVRFGTSVRELVQRAGGMRQGDLRAALVGGAAGRVLAGDELDQPLDAARLGVGAVVALDESTNVTDVLVRIAAFFRDESCGQCVPCRVGTVRQEELLHRVASGRLLGSVEDERARFDDLVAVMGDASICGLGQLATTAAASVVGRGDLFEEPR